MRGFWLGDLAAAIRGGRRRAGPGYVRLPRQEIAVPLRSLFTGASAKGEGTTRAGRPCGHHMRLASGTLLAEGAWQEAQIDHLAPMPRAIWQRRDGLGSARQRPGREPQGLWGHEEIVMEIAGVRHSAVIYANGREASAVGHWDVIAGRRQHVSADGR